MTPLCGSVGEALGGKDVLPTPFAVGVGVFAFQGVGEIDGTVAAVQVMQMDQFDALEVLPEWFNEAFREHRDAVYFAFATAHGDLAIGKINVLDPQA